MIAAAVLLWSLREVLLLLFAAVVLAMALCTLVGIVRERRPMDRSLALLLCLGGLLTIFTVMLALRLRAQVDTDDETEDTPEEPPDSESTVISSAAQPETLHVPDYNHLVGGGVYDQSTGHVAYIDPEGRWWWQQEDGSFFYDPTFNANDATQDDLP